MILALDGIGQMRPLAYVGRSLLYFLFGCVMICVTMLTNFRFQCHTMYRRSKIHLERTVFGALLDLLWESLGWFDCMEAKTKWYTKFQLVLQRHRTRRDTRNLWECLKKINWIERKPKKFSELFVAFCYFLKRKMLRLVVSENILWVKNLTVHVL